MCYKWCPNVSIAFGIFATLGIFYAFGSSDWKRYSEHHGTPKYYQRFLGLWVICEHKSPGVLCQPIIPFFEIPGTEFVMMRILMSISAGCALLGLIASIFGLDCVKAISKERTHKWIRLSGNVLMIFAGVLCGIGATWYYFTNWYLYPDLYNPIVVIGSSTYVAFTATCLAILAGIMGCGNCTSAPNFFSKFFQRGTDSSSGSVDSEKNSNKLDVQASTSLMTPSTIQPVVTYRQDDVSGSFVTQNV